MIFTKDGCPPPEVTLVAGGVPHRDCDIWRSNAERQIAALHPAIVFVSWARWIEANAVSESGVPSGFGGAWQDGVTATFSFLHRVADRVIFISDVPTLNIGAADCISRHINDVQTCNDTPRSNAVVLPAIRTQEFQLAALMHVESIDPIPWFCTATVCPVLVRNFLVYRDSAHMTPAWSRFIAPVLAASIGG